MKKLIGIVLLFGSLLLTACGMQNKQQESSLPTSSIETTEEINKEVENTPTLTATDTSGLTATSVPTPTIINTPVPTATSIPTVTPTPMVAFEEVIVIDNEECAIKITDIDADNRKGFTLKIFLENKSADKTYMYSLNEAAINGVQIEEWFATSVAAGKKANDTLILYDLDALKEKGLLTCTDIELTFRVYDSNDWLADDVVRETVHVYPYGKEKAEVFVREAFATDVVLVDNEYVTVIIENQDYDENHNYAIDFYLLNKTDTAIMFSTREVSVNGYMVSSSFSKEVLPGKTAFTTMEFYKSTLEDTGIANVDNIECNLVAYDSDNWSTDDFVNEVVVLKAGSEEGEEAADVSQNSGFEKKVVVDNEECTINITGVNPKKDYEISVQLENKSTDKSYRYSIENIFVNGVQSDAYLGTVVAAGKKANDVITFSSTEVKRFKENGITEYTDIEICFRVYDENDWGADDVAQESVCLYPHGEDKAAEYTRKILPSDTVLVDNEYVTVLVSGYEYDDYWGYVATLFLVNKTEEELTFNVEETSINGYMIDSFFWETVEAGKCKFDTISWDEDDLQENGIVTIENIELLLQIYETENYNDEYVNEVFILEP